MLKYRYHAIHVPEYHHLVVDSVELVVSRRRVKRPSSTHGTVCRAKKVFHAFPPFRPPNNSKGDKEPQSLIVQCQCLPQVVIFGFLFAAWPMLPAATLNGPFLPPLYPLYICALYPVRLKNDSLYPLWFGIQMKTYIDFYGLTIVVVVDDGLAALFDFQCVLRTETTDDLDIVGHDAERRLGGSKVLAVGCWGVGVCALLHSRWFL